MLRSVILSNNSRRTAVDEEARPTNRTKTFAPSFSLPSALLLRATTRLPKLHRAAKSLAQRRSKRMSTHGVEVNSNVLVWMQESCPSDLLPKIFTFCGPQTMAVLSRTSHFFHDTMQQEGTWMVLCTELGKWNEGDAQPSSWKEHYKANVIVPLDYSSIEAALAVSTFPVQDGDGRHPSRGVTQHRSLRILLQPANYYLREAITIEALETTEITIETIFPVKQPVTSFSQRQDDAKGRTPSPKKRALKRATSFRNMLNCRSVPDIDAIDTMECEEEALLEFSSPVCASLQLRTRRHNEPIFRVRYGTIKLVNVQLVHNSHGIDIWNGNAAIQIQPAIGPDDEMMIPMSVPRPIVCMEKVDITSISGRGIVNIDGGFVFMKQCYVHDCAATGIYIGGPGTDAVIESSDVVRNGNGNKMRRGIARGHSGIYLEQGNALVRDCNISRNSLTGISAVSLENAILNVHDSDLVANGTTQLELPPQGSTARRLSSSVGNFIFPAGISRPRSGLADEDPEAQVSTD